MKKWISKNKPYISGFNILCYVLILTIFTCKKEDRLEVEPEIRNVSISKDTLNQGIGTGGDDFFIFSFNFLNQFGEPGFDSETDSIRLSFFDLRFSTLLPVITFYISPAENNSLITITDGDIKVNVPTTCCAFDPNGNPPCSPVEGYFEAVSYEVEYSNNLGYDLPKDTIEFIVDCSF